MERPEYLNHLANLASEWFNERPSTSKQLDKRLREFRKACDTLLAADNQQLPVKDRTWLLEKCRLWSMKFDEKIAELAQSGNISKIQADGDALVRNLVKALREQAANSI